MLASDLLEKLLEIPEEHRSNTDVILSCALPEKGLLVVPLLTTRTLKLVKEPGKYRLVLENNKTPKRVRGRY